MRTKWKRALLAAVAASTLMASGVASAMPGHGDGHPGDGHGKGGPHGSDDGGTLHDGAGGPGRGPGSGKGNGGDPCDPAAVAAVRAAVDAACPCAGVDDGQGGVTPWRNHGRYVRCVARAVRDELRGAGLKRRCLRDAVPCAARSTCGKSEAVACVTTTPGACVGGLCADEPETVCVLDADCAVRACRVTKAERCAASGGVASAGSCCLASPSGAFVDPTQPF